MNRPEPQKPEARLLTVCKDAYKLARDRQYRTTPTSGQQQRRDVSCYLSHYLAILRRMPGLCDQQETLLASILRGRHAKRPFEMAREVVSIVVAGHRHYLFNAQ